MTYSTRLLADDEPLGSIAKKVREAVGIDISGRSGRRWALQGIGGVVLESVKVAGRRYTTSAAVRRFISETQAQVDAEGGTGS